MTLTDEDRMLRRAIVAATSLRLAASLLGWPYSRLTERMRRNMETEVFYWHGYTDIWIDGDWRKATPAFNLSLCQKFGLKPLDFDGLADSIYHPFDLAGNRHMEYMHQRGSFDDLPLDAILVDFRQHYPQWLASMGQQPDADFLADVAAETGRSGA